MHSPPFLTYPFESLDLTYGIASNPVTKVFESEVKRASAWHYALPAIP